MKFTYTSGLLYKVLTVLTLGIYNVNKINKLKSVQCLLTEIEFIKLTSDTIEVNYVEFFNNLHTLNTAIKNCHSDPKLPEKYKKKLIPISYDIHEYLLKWQMSYTNWFSSFKHTNKYKSLILEGSTEQYLYFQSFFPESKFIYNDTCYLKAKLKID